MFPHVKKNNDLLLNSNVFRDKFSMCKMMMMMHICHYRLLLLVPIINVM